MFLIKNTVLWQGFFLADFLLGNEEKIHLLFEVVYFGHLDSDDHPHLYGPPGCSSENEMAGGVVDIKIVFQNRKRHKA